MKKCAYCLNRITGKLYKKGKRHFCSKEHKDLFFDSHVPTLLDEIQVEFNRLVAKDQSCAVCGKKFETMQCSHIWSVKAHPSIRFDILNVLPMCGHCHNFWCHLNPMDAHDWFVKNYPERNDYLNFAKEQSKPWTADELHKIRQAIKDKDFKSLIRFYKEYEKIQLQKN